MGCLLPTEAERCLELLLVMEVAIHLRTRMTMKSLPMLGIRFGVPARLVFLGQQSTPLLSASGDVLVTLRFE
jgi:hypothetical protein